MPAALSRLAELAAGGASTMPANRRPPKAGMLYYDDARHANLYVVEPDGGEPNELDVLHAVDVVRTSQPVPVAKCPLSLLLPSL